MHVTCPEVGTKTFSFYDYLYNLSKLPLRTILLFSASQHHTRQSSRRKLCRVGEFSREIKNGEELKKRKSNMALPNFNEVPIPSDSEEEDQYEGNYCHFCL